MSQEASEGLDKAASEVKAVQSWMFTHPEVWTNTTCKLATLKAAKIIREIESLRRMVVKRARRK